jgi:hypothetical protein
VGVAHLLIFLFFFEIIKRPGERRNVCESRLGPGEYDSVHGIERKLQKDTIKLAYGSGEIERARAQKCEEDLGPSGTRLSMLCDERRT